MYRSKLVAYPSAFIVETRDAKSTPILQQKSERSVHLAFSQEYDIFENYIACLAWETLWNAPARLWPISQARLRRAMSQKERCILNPLGNRFVSKLNGLS